jgi:catechol 2,3-dioxygenase
VPWEQITAADLVQSDTNKEGAMGESIHPETRIGHVHLRGSDLRRATDFYHDVLGFDINLYGPDDFGAEIVLLSAGGYHHQIGLNTWRSAGGTPPPEGHTGLYHVAILYPDRRELAKAVKRVLDHGCTLTGSEYDSMSERVYLDDPDGNGLELTCDRPKDQWIDENGSLIVTMPTKFDPEDLLAELDPA